MAPVDLERLGHVLEAVTSEGGSVESVPTVDHLTRDDTLDAIEELLARGWVTATAANRGDNRLLSVRGVRVTAAGTDALRNLRSAHRGHGGPTDRADRTPLDQKKQQRLLFMSALYEKSDGSTDVMLNMWELGDELGWDRATTNRTVDYLEAEGLLEFPAMGGEIAITHAGVVEIEQSLSRPEAPTEHFPPSGTVNILNVQTMIGSQVQQGTTGGEQHLEYLVGSTIDDLKALLQEIREQAVTLLEPDSDEFDEVSTDIDIAERQLSARQVKRRPLRDTLTRLAATLTAAGGVGGAAVKLSEYGMKLHELLPGL